jgi:hypothetical protein
MTEAQPNRTEILPIASYANTPASTHANTPASTPVHFVVMGIPVQSLLQAKKISRLLWIAFGWFIFVCIDHSASIHYSTINAKDLYDCQKITAAANGQGSTNTGDSEQYNSFVLVGYVLSWIVATSIPCIGYSGAKRKLRGHINVFRVFGGCFACISTLVAVDNFLNAHKISIMTEEYLDQVHESCARLAVNAEPIHIAFGCISLLLAVTQFSAFVFANQVYYDLEFWGITPVDNEDSDDLEVGGHVQSVQVPFARIELRQPLSNLLPLDLDGSMTEEDLTIIAGINNGGGAGGGADIPTAKEVVAPPPTRRSVSLTRISPAVTASKSES